MVVNICLLVIPLRMSVGDTVTINWDMHIANSRIIMHDNARAHNAHIVISRVRESVTIRDHLLYALGAQEVMS